MFRIKTTCPILSLKTDLTEAVTRAALSTMLQMPEKEKMVLQIIFGPSYTPTPMPHNLPDPHASWLWYFINNLTT